MAFMWYMLDISMVFIRCLYGIRMARKWYSYGIYICHAYAWVCFGGRLADNKRPSPKAGAWRRFREGVGPGKGCGSSISAAGPRSLRGKVRQAAFQQQGLQACEAQPRDGYPQLPP